MKWGIIFIAFLFIGQMGLPQPLWTGKPFIKTAENPIMGADSSFSFFCPIQQKVVQWQRADVFNPAAIVRRGKVYLLFRAEDNPKAEIGGRTSRIGLAESDNGIHFKKFGRPVLYPDNDEFTKYDYPGGCEDPRVIETENGQYVMAYTSWNGKTARLSIAFSTDLLTWVKKGPAFLRAYDGKYKDQWSKSGSMITGMKNGKMVALKIDGKYWMYWGEHFINLAWSDDLFNWNPLEKGGKLRELVNTRKGKFDSELTECGPPAVLTKKGILLLYNGKNANDTERASPDIPKGSYTVGQILFDPKHPERVMSRSDEPFLKPSLPHELTGQYTAGTTFSEGLIYFKWKWFLYYGTADSYVGLAIKE